MKTFLKKIWLRLFRKKSLKQIAVRYFEEHPQARDGVMKAYYAYHANHFRLEPKGHNFTSGDRHSKCLWCGRSREMVRHDNLPPECLERPKVANIEDSILDEEVSALNLLSRAEKEVPNLLRKMGVSGKTLAVLHHTYGYPPETVADFTLVSDAMMEEYKFFMKAESERSRHA